MQKEKDLGGFELGACALESTPATTQAKEEFSIDVPHDRI